VKFGSDLEEFLGFSLKTNRENEVEVDLFFRPLRQIESNYLIKLYLLDEEGEVLGATEQEPATMVWYPTSRWQPGEVAGVHVEAVPWDTRPFSAYQLALGVLNHSDPWEINARLRPAIEDSQWQGWLPADGTLLGIAQVKKTWGIAEGSPQWQQFTVPPWSQPAEAQFRDGISLTAAHPPQSSAEPDDELRVTLFWRATRGVEASYVTFVHLLDPDGQLRAQSDQIPSGALPTYVWSPDEVVSDLHVITLDGSLPSGEYTLVAGMYDSLTLERLALLSASGPFGQDNVVSIGKVSVK